MSEEAGGIDLLVVYNSGRYRMAGRGSSAGLLAYGNANQIVKEMAYEVLPVVKRTPVLAGVNGTDPFIIPRLFLEELRTLGFAGIQNFPTVGLFDGDIRQAFEETGMSYQLEVDIVRLARPMDLLTTPYVFNPSEAERMADAGADLIVAHMGVTTGGSIGAKSSKTLDDCVARIQRIADAARGVNPEVFVICHGGPISEPPDAEYIITKCRASMASTGPVPWNAFRLSAPSRNRSGCSSGSACRRARSEGPSYSDSGSEGSFFFPNGYALVAGPRAGMYSDSTIVAARIATWPPATRPPGSCRRRSAASCADEHQHDRQTVGQQVEPSRARRRAGSTSRAGRGSRTRSTSGR